MGLQGQIAAGRSVRKEILKKTVTKYSLLKHSVVLGWGAGLEHRVMRGRNRLQRRKLIKIPKKSGSGLVAVCQRKKPGKHRKKKRISGHWSGGLQQLAHGEKCGCLYGKETMKMKVTHGDEGNVGLSGALRSQTIYGTEIRGPKSSKGENQGRDREVTRGV